MSSRTRAAKVGIPPDLMPGSESDARIKAWLGRRRCSPCLGARWPDAHHDRLDCELLRPPGGRRRPVQGATSTTTRPPAVKRSSSASCQAASCRIPRRVTGCPGGVPLRLAEIQKEHLAVENDCGLVCERAEASKLLVGHLLLAVGAPKTHPRWWPCVQIGAPTRASNAIWVFGGMRNGPWRTTHRAPPTTRTPPPAVAVS